jgi:hypothetical protein
MSCNRKRKNKKRKKLKRRKRKRRRLRNSNLLKIKMKMAIKGKLLKDGAVKRKKGRKKTILLTMRMMGIMRKINKTIKINK